MDDKQTGYKKGQTHPEIAGNVAVEKQSDKPAEGSIPNKFVSWLNKTTTPIVEKLNMLVTLLLALAAIFLSLFALSQQQDVKGMKELIHSFKPIVKYVPMSFIHHDSVIDFKLKARNSGFRDAINVSSKIYFVFAGPSGVIDENDITTIRDIAPNESITYEGSYPMDEKTKTRFRDVMICLKVTYTDEATDVRDSTFSVFAHNPKNAEDTAQMYPVFGDNDYNMLKNKIDGIN